MHTVVDSYTIETPATVMLHDQPRRARRPVTTTLYDLIATIQSTVEPHNDALVVATAWHLLRSGRATWSQPSPTS